MCSLLEVLCIGLIFSIKSVKIRILIILQDKLIVKLKLRWSDRKIDLNRERNFISVIFVNVCYSFLLLSRIDNDQMVYRQIEMYINALNSTERPFKQRWKHCDYCNFLVVLETIDNSTSSRVQYYHLNYDHQKARRKM